MNNFKTKFTDTISVLIYWKHEDDVNVLFQNLNGRLSLPRCEASSGLWQQDAGLFIEKIIPDCDILEDDLKLSQQTRVFLPSLGAFVYHVTFSFVISNTTNKISSIDKAIYKIVSKEQLSKSSTFVIDRKKTLELISQINTNDLTINTSHIFEEFHSKAIQLFTAEICKGKYKLSTILKAPGYSKQDLNALYEEFVTRSFPYLSLVFEDIKDLLHQAGCTGNEETVFRAMDLDNSGEIDLKQFLMGMSCMDPLTQHGDVTGECRCKYIFRLYDSDGDEYLSESEITNMVKDIYTLQKGSSATTDVIKANTNSAYKIFGLSVGEKLNLDTFLQAVGTLRYRGTSLLFRANNSIPIILMKMKHRMGMKKRRSLSESEIQDSGAKKIKTAVQKINNNLDVNEVVNVNEKKKKDIKYSLAEHTVKVRRTGCITTIDNLIDMERAGELLNTGLDVDDVTMTDEEEVLSNFGVPIEYNVSAKTSQSYISDVSNYRKKVSKQFSAQAFNIKSLPNEIIIALEYFEHKAKDKLAFQWGPVDMMKMGRYLISLCDFLQDILQQEPRLLNITPPCYVLGDLHGNYEDLVCFEKTLWRLGPHLTPANFLFLGDYVDRGDYGVEVIAYLFAQKLRAPAHFHLLRGNHEIREIQKNFTFYNECLNKFGSDLGERLWEKINKVFDCMPLAAVVGRKIFCMHGGIPGLVMSMEELCKIPCPLPLPETQSPAAWQLMWNDPVAAEDLNPNIQTQLQENGGFAFNEKRQTGCIFNKEAFDAFLTKNNFSHVIRAHEVKQVGFEIQQSGRLLTVFSSSRYCGGCNEAASILINDYRIRVIRIDTSKPY